ncbi:MAG: L-seryl-tRNA(Sec) selenium transferase [Chloracidobacterium sp.]|nr:L-seryl-tRNA(Sec) selenium transferase [Chloracidobacterium sp.]MDW8217625.1 L-seryl-tRNA(Sec) selenium transferase [Acidobacteriota bacterium]
MTPEGLRVLPSVERLAQTLDADPTLQAYTPAERRAAARAVIAQRRAELIQNAVALGGLISEQVFEQLCVAARLRLYEARSLRPVINATGVILHTNLGRAPLPQAALEAIAEIAGGYANLEYDLTTGRRGRRDAHGEALWRELLGCEAAVVVNNCAAAVWLVLEALGRGGAALISRGELVEIGGGFRIPDIMAYSGVALREVGTTNRTRLADYEAALTPDTRLIVRVHQSNFRMTGFTARPTVAELAELAKQHGLILFDDIGSGLLADLTADGLHDEPMPARSLADGADVVTFSADKLLGGPQAGVIAGRRDLIEQIRRRPLMRVLRADKLTYAALEAVLRLYRAGNWAAIPILAMLRTSPLTLKRRAQQLARRLRRRISPEVCRIELAPGASAIGGGCAPNIELPTTLVALVPKHSSTDDLTTQLRQASPPVITRTADGRILLDPRTVFPSQEAALVSAVVASVTKACGAA